jgi:hypothetical protein
LGLGIPIAGVNNTVEKDKPLLVWKSWLKRHFLGVPQQNRKREEIRSEGVDAGHQKTGVDPSGGANLKGNDKAALCCYSYQNSGIMVHKGSTRV